MRCFPAPAVSSLGDHQTILVNYKTITHSFQPRVIPACVYRENSPLLNGALFFCLLTSGAGEHA